MSVLLFIYSYKRRLTTYDIQYAANDSIVVLVLPKNNVDPRCLRFSKTKIASNDCFGWMGMDGWIHSPFGNSFDSFIPSFIPFTILLFPGG
jgi:hypothetical protein